MYDIQGLIFQDASDWSAATALVVLGIGLLYLLQGFRFARFLIPVSCAGGGLALGGILAGLVGLPASVPLSVAAVLGILALFWYRRGLTLASGFTLGALGLYLASQVGLPPNIMLVIGGGGFVAGLAAIWICGRTLPILVTVVQGAGLLVVGFVGLTTALAPSLGVTFVEWATQIRVMVPALMVMLCVLGYSVQANAFQGDIESGGNPGLNDLETR